jgi:hypothetical protein
VLEAFVRTHLGNEVHARHNGQAEWDDHDIRQLRFGQLKQSLQSDCSCFDVLERSGSVLRQRRQRTASVQVRSDIEKDAAQNKAPNPSYGRNASYRMLPQNNEYAVMPTMAARARSAGNGRPDDFDILETVAPQL